MARAGRLFLVTSALALAGCSETFLEPRWFAAVDTAVIYSLARPELELESAFNFYDRTSIPLQRPGASTQWDVALDTRDGQLVLLTPAALGITSRVRVATLAGQTFDQVEEAPADTLLYTGIDPVPVQMNAVYIVRTDVRSQSPCSHYVKLQPTMLDVAAGRLEFMYDVNPLCNDRRLVPPDTT
jgi:hypothetical protein